MIQGGLIQRISGSGGGGQIIIGRIVTASGAVTITSADYYVEINKTIPAATAIGLPASPAQWTTFIIKDGAGNASTYNITITPGSGLIDGSATFVMDANYQSITFIYNGTNWGVN